MIVPIEEERKRPIRIDISNSFKVLFLTAVVLNIKYVTARARQHFDTPTLTQNILNAFPIQNSEQSSQRELYLILLKMPKLQNWSVGNAIYKCKLQSAKNN